MTPQQMEALLRPTEAGDPMAVSQVSAFVDAGDHGAPGATARSHGIGLAIVRAVVERHGGLLEGFSAPGVGTMFVFDLPLHLSTGEADA